MYFVDKKKTIKNSIDTISKVAKPEIFSKLIKSKTVKTDLFLAGNKVGDLKKFS